MLSDWFLQQNEFVTSIENMEEVELAKCLEKFYLSARQKDGNYYGASSLKSIRAGLDGFLQSLELKKPYSIISDPEFLQANKVLDAFVKTLRKDGDIAGVVHKDTLTREVVEKLFETGSLVLQIQNIQLSSRTRFGFTFPFILEREAEKIRGI